MYIEVQTLAVVASRRLVVAEFICTVGAAYAPLSSSVTTLLRLA